MKSIAGLALALLLWTIAQPAHAQKRIALLIGNQATPIHIDVR